MARLGMVQLEAIEADGRPLAHCCMLTRSIPQLSLRRRLVGCLPECHPGLQLVTLLKTLPLGLPRSAELPKGVMEPLGEFSDLLLVTGGLPRLPQLLSGLIPCQPQLCSTTSVALLVFSFPGWLGGACTVLCTEVPVRTTAQSMVLLIYCRGSQDCRDNSSCKTSIRSLPLFLGLRV